MRERCSFLVALLLLAAPAAWPADADDGGGRNLKYSVVMVETAPNGEVGRRTARILAVEGKRVDLVTGRRVPIPVKTTEGDEQPVTAYSYQDVGFLSWLEGRILSDRSVYVTGRIELSALEPPAPGAGAVAPTLESFNQKFEVVLPPDTEVALAEVPRPGGGGFRLTLAVEIQP